MKAALCLAGSAVLSLLSLGVPALAQNNYLYAIGNTNFGVNIPIEDGFINVANGEVHLEIPLANQAQRGNLKLDERLVYDSRIWMIGHYSNYYWWPTNIPNSSDGWRFVSGNDGGTVQENLVSSESESCNWGDYEVDKYQFTWTDPSGVVHPFNSLWTETQSTVQCQHTLQPQRKHSWADDASGYQIVMTGGDMEDPDSLQILDKNGTQIYPSIADRFGNDWTKDASGNLVDDLGRTPVEVTTNGNQTTYSVLVAGGGRVNYVVTMETISVATVFDENQVQEWSGTLLTVQSIQLPDGSSYSFTYGSYGEMTSMTLPTGGTVNFGWGNYSDSYKNVNRWLTSYSGGHGSMAFNPTVITQCGRPNDVGCVEQITKTDGSGNDVNYLLTLNNGSWNTTRTYYQGHVSGGAALVTTATAYDFSQSCPSGVCTGADFVTKQSDTTTLDDVNQSTETVYSIDSSTGDPDSVETWKYYTGQTPDAVAVDRQFTYSPYDVPYNDNSGQYYAEFFLSSAEVTDGGAGAASEVSLTSYAYSPSSNTTTSGIVGHGTPPTGQSGPFLTSVGQWVNTDGSTLTSTFTNDDTGSQTSSTTPNGETTYSRDATDTFITTLTPPTPSSGVSLPQNATYDASTGLVTSRTDPNGETTTYHYDSENRSTEIDYPDGGTETFAYPSAYEVDESRTMNGSQSEMRDTQVDGYGRLSRDAVYNGQPTNPWYQVDYCYGPDGRLSFRSYRYQGPGFSQAKVCSGAGDSYSYDALGRLAEVDHADGTSVKYQRTGRAVEIKNESGEERIIERDALGRIAAVCEISSGANMPQSGSPVNCGLDYPGTGFLTTYSYDLANHKTTVSQGAQTRVFQTDSLGRTVMVQQPESGATTYSYAWSNTPGLGLTVTRKRPKANQTVQSVLTTTTRQYDALGRIVRISYDDGLTPTKNFHYDQATIWGSSAATTGAAKGRLTDENGEEAFVYGPMGRVVKTLECLPTWCGNPSRDKWIDYSYDLAGDMTSAGDGAGVTASYTYSSALEIQSITSSLNDATHPGAVVSNVQDGPDGPLSYHLGNGLGVALLYDSMGRLAGKYTCSGSAAVDCAGGTPISSWWTARTGSHVTTGCHGPCDSYGYDQLGRLASDDVYGGGPQVYNWVYDRYGNRWQQNPQQGGQSSNLTFNPANNQITTTGYEYDAAGNLIQDPEHSYTYDAEGNLIEVDGGAAATYTYDALNRRVEIEESGHSEGFVYNLEGQRMSSWDLSTGGEEQGEKYWGNLPVEFDWDNQANFDHADWLGTIRAVTDHAGSNESTYTSLPYGDGSNATGNGYSPWQYAGLDKDYYANADSGTDHAQFREYGDEEGRWMSPDPYLGSYNFANPQSFNRYSYVMNDPLSASDPDGLSGEGIFDGGSTAGGCIGAALSLGHNPWADIGCGYSIFRDLLGLFSKPAFHGSLKPRPSTGSPAWITNSGESLGLPAGTPLNNVGLAQAFGLPEEGCEFGACSGGPSSFVQGQDPKNPSKLIEFGPGSFICGDFVCGPNGRLGIAPCGGCIHDSSGLILAGAGIAREAGEIGAEAAGEGASSGFQYIFRPGSWLNQGQYWRIGFGRNGGLRVFRSVIFGWKKDWWTGGPL